jgi:hypothetical protein
MSFCLKTICKSRCTTGINDTGGKFVTGINITGINITGGKFATGINNFAASSAVVVDTGGALSAANISANFRKHLKQS